METRGDPIRQGGRDTSFVEACYRFARERTCAPVVEERARFARDERAAMTLQQPHYCGPVQDAVDRRKPCELSLRATDRGLEGQRTHSGPGSPCTSMKLTPEGFLPVSATRISSDSDARSSATGSTSGSRSM